jgi:hypothetical protein
MITGVSIQVLGTLRAGVFTRCPLQPCSSFHAERIAIGSTAWSFPALVIDDSTVSPRHAVMEPKDQGWVIQDLDSDNGIRCVQFSSGQDVSVEDPGQASRLEFSEEMCCCVGAVVLGLRALRKH